jgi:hypothetical protein
MDLAELRRQARDLRRMADAAGSAPRTAAILLETADLMEAEAKRIEAELGQAAC